MKNYLVSSFYIFIFCFTIQSKAMTWEVGLKVLNPDGSYARALVQVYVYDGLNHNFITSYIGYTEQNSYNFAGNVNGAFDIGALDSNTTYYTIPPLGLVNNIYIRIGNKFVTLSRTSGAYGDITLRFQFNEFDDDLGNTSGYVVSATQNWTDYNITLKNDLGGDRADYTNVKGKIYLDNIGKYDVGYNGQTFQREATTFPHEIYGEDNQYVNTYYRKWRNWGDNYPTIYRELGSPNHYNHTAVYARICNITVQNDFGASGSGGNIKFQSTQYSSPYQPSITYEDINYNAEALSHTINSVYYTFKTWDFNSTNISTQNPITTFRPTAHGTLKAKFNGKPLNTYRNQSYGTVNYSPVVINWSKHPLDNSEVTQYAIWRSVKHNGVTGTPQQIGTVTANGSSSYSFTDYDYVRTPTYVDDLLHYDVRAYYQPSQTYSDADWVALYGTQLFKMNENNSVKAEISREIPKKYEINNYPNPFNPTTIIHYQLPADGSVTLKIYDMLGKEIAVLVNGHKLAGYYNVTFDASNLASGIYIYTIQANNFIQSKKMLLVK